VICVRLGGAASRPWTLMNLSIRSLNSAAELSACEAMQRQAWAMPDDLEVVPAHLLVAVQRNGGVLLGAFDAGDLVGFVFSFPALAATGGLKHCSHLMAVAPSHQSKGIGYQLKLAQRQQVLDQGIDLITWTFDPLESRNAYLNIRKLGGVCSSYYRDYYGPLTDGLSSGLPSDRFEVEWWIASERVLRRLAGDLSGESGDAVVQANAAVRRADGYLAPGVIDLGARTGAIRIEIPADYQVLKSAAPDLALEWRLAVREMAESYFAAGYVVDDVFHTRTPEGERSTYILRAE
jgi:predicted GNAT superfamily acetyltransferase